MSSAGPPRQDPTPRTSVPGALARSAVVIEPRSRLRRTADAFALLCVAGAALAVSLAAAPSIARQLGWTRASLSHRPWNAPSTGGAPRNEPILVDPDVFEPLPDRSGHAIDELEDEDRAPPARFAVAVRDIVVRSAASEGARSVAEVTRGELLLVIREEGKWAMVAHIADDGGATGWVLSGDLAIR